MIDDINKTLNIKKHPIRFFHLNLTAKCSLTLNL